jgi:hypothetical protein
MRGKTESPTYTHERSGNIEEGTIKSVLELDFEPKDIDQLYTLHKVDRQKYKITNYWSKLKSNKKFTSSVLASAKKPKDYNQDDFAKFLLTYNPKPLTINKTEDSGYKEVVDIELSVADFHLAKKTINNETLAERTEVFMRMCRNLIERAHSIYRINTVVFVISNDFFHTDTFGNTTTNGTPQEVITTYDHEYEVGFDLLVSAISLLKEYAREVHVVLVQGNHDRTKSFYVAHALEVFFKGEKNITFDRKHSTTKSVVLGNTFIGYHHGNCKMDDLPLLFATGNDSADFGNSKFREVHTGDKHHYLCKEVK